LKVDESSLTGESDHVKKGEQFDPMVLSGMNNLVFSCKRSSIYIFFNLRNPCNGRQWKNVGHCSGYKFSVWNNIHTLRRGCKSTTPRN